MDIRGLLTKQIALKNVVVDGVSLEHPRYSNGVLYGSESVAPISTSDEASQKAIESIKKAGANFEQVDIAKIAKNAEKTADAAKSIKSGVEMLSNFRSSKTDENDKPVRYQLVGETEADAKAGRISYNSPLGRALIGRVVEDEVELTVPSGDKYYLVSKIEFI